MKTTSKQYIDQTYSKYLIEVVEIVEHQPIFIFNKRVMNITKWQTEENNLLIHFFMKCEKTLLIKGSYHYCNITIQGGRTPLLNLSNSV